MPKRHNSTFASNNQWGFRGVEWDAARGMFRARIEPANGKRGRFLGRYATAQEAAEAYDEAARIEYGEEAFLNFPRAGEKQTIQHSRSDGHCVHGHDLANHGYARPDGRGVNCRECNRNAAQRAYQRRRQMSRIP